MCLSFPSALRHRIQRNPVAPGLLWFSEVMEFPILHPGKRQHKMHIASHTQEGEALRDALFDHTGFATERSIGDVAPVAPGHNALHGSKEIRRIAPESGR